jgi:hypothetical protein
MTPELTTLARAGLLQAVQYVLMAVPANLELGTARILSPRDPHRFSKPQAEQVSPRTGLPYRALKDL